MTRSRPRCSASSRRAFVRSSMTDSAGESKVRTRPPLDAQFPEPSRFEVGRTPNRHLAFGLGGPHFCLGAHLARLELRVWLEEMLPVLDAIELAGTPARLRSNFFHGIKALPVRFR